MTTFNNDPAQKAERMKEVEHHITADMLVKGTYGEGEGDDFKGCSIGCLYGDHIRGEKKDGIPRELLKLCDDLFEALPNSELDGEPWHRLWFDAVPVGADLSRVWHQYDYWIVHDPVDGVVAIANEETKALIDKNEHLLKNAAYGDMPTKKEFDKAARPARPAPVDREAWAAREAREAWEARVDRVDRAAWAARAARAAREAWETRVAWEARVDRVDRVDRAAWEAWATRVDRAAWAEKQARKLLELIGAAK